MKLFFTNLTLFLFVSVKGQNTPAPDVGYPGKKNQVDSSKNLSPAIISVEKDASFPGGTSSFFSFIRKNLRYPQDSHDKGIQGEVVVAFEVREDGRLNNVHVQKGLAPDLDAEAVRVVSESPAWMPAIQNGRAVKAKFTVPVTFKLN
ncbi:MAG TPA: energy transducer TonB [Mucilaginibacter sp.]|nr:energy transducer TonB [Mucilaginibacter sp.]